MRYLVTGGAGFIGSHLVDRLVADAYSACEPYEIIIFDNFSLGKRSNLARHLSDTQVRIIEGDLRNSEAIATAMQGIDVVFHLAANSDIKESAKNPRIDFDQGSVATLNVLEAMRNNNVKRIVFASSSAIYGELKKFPASEDIGPLFPISFYGAAKLHGEALISAYVDHFGFQAWICRFGNVLGARGTHGVVVDFHAKLLRNPAVLEVLGDGTQAKPYSEPKDLVDGILFIFRHAQERLNYYQVGCDTATPVATIARILLEEMKLFTTKISYTGGDRGWKGDVPQVRYDVSKINQLGWKSRYTSDEAVRVAIREFLAERQRA